MISQHACPSPDIFPDAHLNEMSTGTHTGVLSIVPGVYAISGFIVVLVSDLIFASIRHS